MTHQPGRPVQISAHAIAPAELDDAIAATAPAEPDAADPQTPRGGLWAGRCEPTLPKCARSRSAPPGGMPRARPIWTRRWSRARGAELALDAVAIGTDHQDAACATDLDAAVIPCARDAAGAAIATLENTCSTVTTTSEAAQYTHVPVLKLLSPFLPFLFAMAAAAPGYTEYR